MLTDTSPMPFGQYKGTEMANVPDTYLKYLYSSYKNQVVSQQMRDVISYIEENIDAINLNIAEDERKRARSNS